MFVISSDFCHWGLNFYYTSLQVDDRIVVADDDGALYKSDMILKGISGLDHRSMDAIETGEYQSFVRDLRATRNTVCGSHPIRVMMAALEQHKAGKADGTDDESRCRFQFVRYERSTDRMSIRESSVSYCSAFAVI